MRQKFEERKQEMSVTDRLKVHWSSSEIERKDNTITICRKDNRNYLHLAHQNTEKVFLLYEDFDAKNALETGETAIKPMHYFIEQKAHLYKSQTVETQVSWSTRLLNQALKRFQKNLA